MIARRLREDLPPYSTTDLHWWTARNDDVGADDIRNVYQALCSSLNQIRKLDLFFVFLSTNYKLSDCSPSSRHSVSWSARIENSGVTHHVQTPYTELPFDVWKESYLDKEGKHTMDDVCSVEFMVRFGRPLCKLTPVFISVSFTLIFSRRSFACCQRHPKPSRIYVFKYAFGANCCRGSCTSASWGEHDPFTPSLVP